MNTPFVNDPFALIFQAFTTLYPDKAKTVTCYVENSPVGWNRAVETSETGATVIVSVRCDYYEATQKFLEDLARVVIGPECKEENFEDIADVIDNIYQAMEGIKC